MIPQLQTERLTLRGQRASDFDAYAAFWAGPRAESFGGPYSRRDAWDSFAQDAGHWVLRGFGQWMLEDKATGEPAGFVGFIRPDRYEEVELGWTLFDAFEGKGLAYEAAMAARASGPGRRSRRAVKLPNCITLRFRRAFRAPPRTRCTVSIRRALRAREQT